MRAKWLEFYKNNSKQPEINNCLYPGVLDPVLDKDLCLADLTKVLRDSRANKSPQKDAIQNEFYKSLPSNGKLYLLNLFNKILREKTEPDSWSHIIQTMIHKKGEKADLNNYRDIVFVNHVTKLFTSMLADWLYNCANNGGILPEG